jgi:hypothetical protein
MLRSRKTYLAGAPLLLVAGIAAVFIWGQLQPKPEGFVPTAVEGAVFGDAGPVQYTIDARDRSEWVFFDFARGSVVESDFEAADWQLAFRRTKLLTNSGVTNPGGPTGVINLGEALLEEVVAPARLDFAVDELGGEDNDTVQNSAIKKWYRYNFIRHVVIARPDVYLIRTGGDRDALVRFDSYYCDDESPGCVTFHYRLVPRASDAGGVSRP